MSETVADDAKKDASESKTNAPASRKKKWPMVVGIIVAALVVAVAGGLVWHNQPSFCNAFCHTPMDGYVQSYEATPNAPATDAWGNDVSNSNAMLAVVHKQAGLNCLSCHQSNLNQQMQEGSEYVSDNFYYPLKERSLSDLVKGAGGDADNYESFCLNSNCHNLTHDQLVAKTANLPVTHADAQGNLFGSLDGDNFNPHTTHYINLECSDCHKAHRASVLYCTQCHSDAAKYLPDGWITYQESMQLEAAQMTK